MGGLFFDGGVPGRKGRVMIVDDEDDVRKPICLALSKAGYEVVEAGSVDQAVQALNEGDNPLVVDTILCDIRMPMKSGTEAIAYFREQYPSIPVVVLTGYPDVQLATSLMKQGVKDYVVKPVTKDILLHTVSRAVDQHVVSDTSFTT